MARLAATGEHKAKAARQMRATAALLDDHHPEMMAGDHLRDAATVLERGSTEGAKRHLDAAMFMLTPQSLLRHGIRDDDGHADAKHHMHQVNRHRLAVEDIEDIHARNDRLRTLARARRGEAPTDDDEIEEARQFPGTIAAAGQPRRVIDLRSDAWKRERRNPEGEWMAGALAAAFTGQVKGKGPSIKEQAAHTGLSKSQRALYRRLRKKGRTHEQAVARAQGFTPALVAAYAGMSNTGRAVELVGPAGYVHGWKFVGVPTFARGTQPGSFEHIREIEDLGDRAAIAAEDPSVRSPTMRAALYNVARSVAMRDMKGARIHLASAKWANKHEARGKYTRDLVALEAQLARVPKEATGFQGRIKNPLSARAQHPGRYESLRDRPPAHPNAGAGAVAYRAAELANRQYRYRHGWVKLADLLGVGSATEAAAKGAGMPLEPPRKPRAKVVSNLASSGHLDGKQVAGTDDSGRMVVGTYSHATGQVIRRHGGKAKVIRVRPVTPADREAVNATPREPRGRLARYRAAANYGLATGTTELSARTPFLARTPAPRGRPGGPGLYDVKGMGHTAYYQQVVKALIEKRGMPPGKAYAIARAAIRKWSVRSKHPEVRGAATAAEAGEVARQARARASHGHAIDSWEVADVLIELAAETPAVIELFNPYHAPTGQFTTASGAGAAQGKGTKAQQRQKLQKEIAGLRRRIAFLRAQLPSGHPHGTRRSKSSAPAKKGAGAQSAKQARQGKQAAQKAGQAKPHAKADSPATIHAKIIALRAQLKADIAQLRKLQ